LYKVLIFLIFCYNVYGWNDSGKQENIPDSTDFFLMAQQYQKALDLARILLNRNPANIEALNLICTIKQTEILDYEAYSIDGAGYIGYADSALSVISGCLDNKRGKDSLDALFYIASILGGKGIILAKNGSWPSAVACALRSSGYLKQIIKIDPSYFAAYYGIGIFNYYLSRNLKWLPFFGDRREEALHQLAQAAIAPFPYNYAAKNSLCWILIERNELASADSIASETIEKYPDNTLFLRIKIRTSIGLMHWNTARLTAQKLIEISSLRTPPNWADMISGYQALACCCDNMGLYSDCREAAGKALSLKVPEAYCKIAFVKKHLKYLADIKKKYDNIYR